MEKKVYVKSYDPPRINKKEIIRYLGAKDDRGIEELIDGCIAEAEGCLTYRLCYMRFPASVRGDLVDLGFATVSSHSLGVCLDGCDEIVLACATVGAGIDRLIRRYSLISPSRAVVMQALGSERVEALLDCFCQELSAEEADKGRVLRPRFSPGYGDLSLELQREIFSVLDPTKQVGVGLGLDLFMTPTKSVTAIIGIKNVK